MDGSDDSDEDEQIGDREPVFMVRVCTIQVHVQCSRVIDIVCDWDWHGVKVYSTSNNLASIIKSLRFTIVFICPVILV